MRAEFSNRDSVNFFDVFVKNKVTSLSDVVNKNISIGIRVMEIAKIIQKDVFSHL